MLQAPWAGSRADLKGLDGSRLSPRPVQQQTFTAGSAEARLSMLSTAWLTRPNDYQCNGARWSEPEAVKAGVELPQRWFVRHDARVSRGVHVRQLAGLLPFIKSFPKKSTKTAGRPFAFAYADYDL